VCSAERRVAAGDAIRVERFRVDAVGDAAQQAQPGFAVLGQRRSFGRKLELSRLLARDGAQRCGRALAEPEAGALVRAFRQLEAREPAREIGADMQDVGGSLLERDQRVERRDAVCLGGRYLEATARVAECALAHPADPALRRAERGEE